MSEIEIQRKIILPNGPALLTASGAITGKDIPLTRPLCAALPQMKKDQYYVYRSSFPASVSIITGMCSVLFSDLSALQHAPKAGPFQLDTVYFYIHY